MKHCGAVQSRLTLAVGDRTPEDLKIDLLSPSRSSLDSLLRRPVRRRPAMDESNSSSKLAPAVIWRNGLFSAGSPASCMALVIQALNSLIAPQVRQRRRTGQGSSLALHGSRTDQWAGPEEETGISGAG